MKGNMFLGYARGSVGDVTFARQKGQQVARARNRKPNNPRTSAQMRQRSRFISAVKFFSRGNQNFFTFAFEDKRPAESDYNAFMRYNSDKGIWMTKGNFDNESYPAIGKFIMTSGSLVGINALTQSGTAFIAQTPIPASGQTATTVGQLSAILVANNAWMVGDIITIVDILSDAHSVSINQPIEVGELAPTWQLRQFIVDPSDTTPLSTYRITVATDDYYVQLVHQQGTTDICGCTIVQSRNSQNGLRVSNSTLLLNADAQKAYEYGTSMHWVNLVLADWKAREEAVLEGGAVPSTDTNSI